MDDDLNKDPFAEEEEEHTDPEVDIDADVPMWEDEDSE